MKTVYRLGSLMVAVALVFGASRLWAENKDKKPVPHARIGLVNLTYVIKNYDKYKQFQDDIKQMVDPFQKRDAQLRAQLDKLRSQVEKPAIVPAKGEERDENARKEALAEKAKKIQRELEDNTVKAKQRLSKKSDDEMKILYKDLEAAVKRYATARGLEVVLHYNDAVNKDDYYSSQNIARKFNSGALMPVYMASGVDISAEIVDDLNHRPLDEK